MQAIQAACERIGDEVVFHVEKAEAVVHLDLTPRDVQDALNRNNGRPALCDFYI